MASKSSKAEKTAKNTTAKKAAVAEPDKAPERVLHKARLTFWSYYCHGVFKEMKFDDFLGRDIGNFSGIDDYDADFSGLRIDGIEGGLKIDGKSVPINFDAIKTRCAGHYNCWQNFLNRSGAYFMKFAKAEEYAKFSFEGDFDPEKLTLIYSTAINPGGEELQLLTSIKYEGKHLHICEPDGYKCRGWDLSFFKDNKYVTDADKLIDTFISYDPSDLEWEPFPIPNQENSSGI